MLTAHGYIGVGVIPFDYMNARQRRVAHPIVLNRTHQFTIPAARAFFRINNHYFLAHRLSPNIPYVCADGHKSLIPSRSSSCVVGVPDSSHSCN